VFTRLGVGFLPSAAPQRSRQEVCWDAVSPATTEKFRAAVTRALEEPLAGDATARTARLLDALQAGLRCLPVRRVRPSTGSLRGFDDPERTLRDRFASMSAWAQWRALKSTRPPPEPPPGLADHFAAASRRSVPQLPALQPLADVPLLDVTTEEVRASVRSHNVAGCVDPHGVSPRLLRLLPTTALDVLAGICTLACRGDVPAQWLKSDVVPVHKGKDRPTDDLAAWRLLSRTWERVVLLRWGHLVPQFHGQYGFRRNFSAAQLLRALRSALHRALRYKERLSRAIGGATAHKVLLACLDCSGAFNAAPVDGIAARLAELRLPEAPGVHRWLLGRSQRLRGEQSWSATSSGVPQGSVLGPLLWLLFLDGILAAADANTLPTNGKAHRRGLYAFADDIFAYVSGVDVDRLCTALERWLAPLVRALADNGVADSVGKTDVTIFATAHGGQGTAGKEYRPVPPSTKPPAWQPVRVLGAVLDPTLSTSTHWEAQLKVVDSALDDLDVLARLGAHPTDVRQLYFAYAVPHMAYCASSMVQLGWNSPHMEVQAQTTTRPYLAAADATQFPDVLPNLERRHLRAARIIAGTMLSAPAPLVLREARLRTLACVLQLSAAREDEKVARRSPADALAPLGGPRMPLLAGLPYHPAWAGTLVHGVRFVCDETPGVTRTSPKETKAAANAARLAAARALLPDAHSSLGTDGGAGVVESGVWNSCGSAVVLDERGVEVATDVVPAGSYGCSYTAECAGGIAGLALLDDMPPGTLLWVLDALSLALALLKGPCRQDDWAEAAIWHALLQLVARGWRIVVVWVFSHTDNVAINDRADALCEAGLEATAGQAPRFGVWWRDAARARCAPVVRDFEASVVALRDSGHPHATPALPLLPRRAPAWRIRLLACLRTGVWSWTGFLQEPSPCRLCGAPVTRHVGVRHIFACPGVPPQPAEDGGPLGEEDLWGTEARQQAAAQYALAYKAAVKARMAAPAVVV
jgi:hypothetical protein